MTSRNVTKVLAGMEDLLTGVGTATQDRNGTSMPITKIDIAFAVATTAAMQALDVTKYTRARVYASESNVVEYLYDSTSNAGLASDTGPGSWLLTAESTKVLGVEDKISLRLTEPSFALQLAVALGGASLGVGYGGVYWYDDTDTTTADDGENVFVTTGGARWKKVSFEAIEVPQLSTAGGTANALTATFGWATIPTDKIIWLKAATDNTGAMTLNIDATGVLPVQHTDGSAVAAGVCETGKVYGYVKVGSTYRIINPSVSEDEVDAGTDNFGPITALRLATVLAPIIQTIVDAQTDATDALAQLVTAVEVDTAIADARILRQAVRAVNTTSATYTTYIPIDGSTPEKTEGTEIFSIVDFTPTEPDSEIEIEVLAFGTTQSGEYIVGALFENTDTYALTACAVTTSNVGCQPIPLKYVVDAVSTTPRTYKFRAGTHFSGRSWYLNRDPTYANVFGTGKVTSVMTIREYAP